ncbi:MAG: GNAT family N-acetyltransferase [Thermoplasmata archaeon]
MTAPLEQGPLWPPPVTIRAVVSPLEVETVRSLFWEYRDWLAVHREVTAFADSILERGLRDLDEEIRLLPGEYRPPHGMLFLASGGGTPIGCAALRQQRPGWGELKRVYVRDSGRGRGIGRRLTRAVLNRAKRVGYDRVVLDTLPTMVPAIALYRSMGFRPIPSYWRHPVPGALFFEYPLQQMRGS